MIQSSNYLIRTLLSLFALFPLSLSNFFDGGTQFIAYNGTIAGQFKHPASAPPDCPTYYFDSLRNSFIFVGVNPPWDTNPFYFGIQHDGEEVDDDSYRCKVNSCTADPIYSLVFDSAASLCFSSLGYQCSDFTLGYHQAPQKYLNLNKATTVQYDWGDAGKGYSVAGDQSTFRGGPYFNEFDFQRPDNYSWQDGCANLLTFEWNSTTPFTYAVNFTNTTAEALFSLTAPLGSVTFSFTGARVDKNTAGSPRAQPYDNGHYTPISMNTSNPSKPSFNFVNGSQFVWKNWSRGDWSAVASAPALSVDKNLALWLKWLWLLSMTVTGGLLTL
ncbi:hypothetical protein CNMCM5793_009371 [Aspergillus hiratsukae]|uniref:Uncharacterized protein n=1 Tax=Aspergillus hiratsukae TaxID=1194566 RepID=A0A8H6PJD7_9EURO|nr:hypothetical protein CNMCM5793_009371 [Aspergillus hiratsukae]KAF7155741.1 hypothetical protein CNMCM6106_007006 [Aspergillus hiratsukae]KAF7155790.1 hypothetical protein CNMCM6106_007055 [Aspergillus hiratsukae]